MNNDEKVNLEILSKIVIQLKNSQIETTNRLIEDYATLKNENAASLMEIRERYDNEIHALKDELNETKIKSVEKGKNYTAEIADLRTKFEKNTMELREDMLKLLRKYEDRFQIQDDEIDFLKKKCEMADCKICSFQSFKVHFFVCEECNSSICTDCLQVCKACRKARCLDCLKKCNVCTEQLCKECSNPCTGCAKDTCRDCYNKCFYCSLSTCKSCLLPCRTCEKAYCFKCAVKCETCNDSVSCKFCYEKDGKNERCICGKLYCFNCEDDCKECTIPCSWENDSRIFEGFHTKSSSFIPQKCLIKFSILHKGIDTTHLGLTCDSTVTDDEKATENFWSICLNSGEKFSTSDYKKKGFPWAKYSQPIKKGDTVYLRFSDGEASFLINRKEYPVAFNLDKNLKYFIYCLTHNDSTKIEIKSLKLYK